MQTKKKEKRVNESDLNKKIGIRDKRRNKNISNKIRTKDRAR